MRFTSDTHHTVKEDTSKTKYDRLELDVCGRDMGGVPTSLPAPTPPPPCTVGVCRHRMRVADVLLVRLPDGHVFWGQGSGQGVLGED